MEAIRSETESLRLFIASCDDEDQIRGRIDSLIFAIEKTVADIHASHMKPVINATGTILHTNLGRAPIPPEHAERLKAIVTGYSNLEYNLEAGKRGERYSHFEQLLCRITGAEAAIAVNNNAAAVMLVLSTIGKDAEVVVSRGELVEIGGKFRIPDVMEQSGAKLVEVGTTNKTHPSDYEDAITEATAALLKVHTSNYRIVGFTESVSVDEMYEIAREHDIPVIEDIGSGVLIDLSRYGITYEPTMQASLAAGASVVCFSGDKLLGGPQAGIVVGKKKYIEKMKKNPLMRAIRIDKFTAAALEMTLQEYLSEANAVQKIPVLQMITRPETEIAAAAADLCQQLQGLPADIRVESCESQIGGGSMPLERLPGRAVVIRPQQISAATLEERLRQQETPVIVRVADDAVHLDLRTIQAHQMSSVVQAVGCALMQA